MCPDMVIHQVACFSQSGGPLYKVHQGFACIAQPLSNCLSGEGASRKSEWVVLTEEAVKAFEALKQACKRAPILVFADYPNCFFWRLMHPKTDWGWWCCRSRADGWYHPIAYGSRVLMPHKKIYHSMNLSF